jgi:hypothetical protein
VKLWCGAGAGGQWVSVCPGFDPQYYKTNQTKKLCSLGGKTWQVFVTNYLEIFKINFSFYLNGEFNVNKKDIATFCSVFLIHRTC